LLNAGLGVKSTEFGEGIENDLFQVMRHFEVVIVGTTKGFIHNPVDEFIYCISRAVSFIASAPAL
jgi:hypothetical protein